jgi:hypothetical protein
MEVTLNKCKGITKGVRALPHNAMECGLFRIGAKKLMDFSEVATWVIIAFLNGGEHSVL